jgi:hypothetical protein
VRERLHSQFANTWFGSTRDGHGLEELSFDQC